ncbi:hypothetical protein L6452_04106 [Arctium lappa]|uniref:Uncharacterized protein n=1 Tax=Arctium lappa TaxID=4217 RepID=A0ACB9FPJ7_ARCLA|nr:hypothetical protein L6452_04106 [Arctium lappa]
MPSPRETLKLVMNLALWIIRTIISSVVSLFYFILSFKSFSSTKRGGRRSKEAEDAHVNQIRLKFGVKDVEAKGFNPGLIVLLVVGGLLITFLVGNYVLYMYAQKTLPPRRKKPVSKKKLKQGQVGKVGGENWKSLSASKLSLS